MRVDIGDGVRLYFDTDGLGSVPVDGKLVERPTLILLHGGPGLDHSTYKVAMNELRDVAQVLMYDHRGHGRSDWRTSDEWNLDTWADDVVRLCDALGIEKPIVLGNSFGGFVAQHYMARHPEHPSKVVLSSTVARRDTPSVLDAFERLGGREVRDVADRFWSNPTREATEEYLRVCGPFYTQSQGNVFATVEVLSNPKMFPFWQAGQAATFDLRPGLANAKCPVLVLGGEMDPVCPIAGSEEIAAHLPSELVQFERFAHSGHGVFRDEPERSMAVLRQFVAR